MCRICADWELGKLTLPEAYLNLQEVWDEEDPHHVDVWVKLIKSENLPEDTF